MLEQARHRLDPGPALRQRDPIVVPANPSRPDSARAEPRSSDGELAYYVYGVASAAGSPLANELPGVDPAHVVETVTSGDLVALVSRVPLADFDEERLRDHLGDMAWVERVARRHEEVLEAAAAGRAVIPMRLCSIYRDASGVLDMLRREAEVMHQALELLAGRSEWGVKMFALPDRPGPPAASEEPVSGADYLERQRQSRSRRGESDQRLAAACEASHARLAALAARALVIAPQRPEVSGHKGEMLLNGVYLLDNGELQRFHDEVASLGEEFSAIGLELQLTGPWPAYNFVPDAIGVSP